MATDHWNVDGIDWVSCNLMHKLVRSDAVERGDANQLLVVQTLFLVELAHGRHNRVHWVDNEAHDCIGAELCNGLHDALCDACVDAQQIRSGHSRLAGQPSWNENKIAASETLLQLVNRLVVFGQ